MAIKIKNLETGRTVVVRNQDDMFDLKQTDDTFDFNDPLDDDKFLASYDLNKYDDKDRQEYINRFSFDPSEAGPGQKQTPRMPTKDVYYDFDGDADDNESAPGEFPSSQFDMDFDINDNSFSDDELDSLDGDSEFDMDKGMDVDMGQGSEEGDEDQGEQKGDYEGEIRSVTGANLVYKRQNQDGTYNELWVYTVGKDMQAEFAIRKAILSGTDIDPNTQQSDDGSQRAISKTVGNVQFINITGLPQ